MAGRLDKIGDLEQLARDAHFDPATLAARCGVSLRQLERFFKRRFHCSPREWVRTLRCRLVIDLVAKGLYEKAVAKELSFADGAHLCHQFKRVYGSSPRNL
jgi:AraC-like DNA-binding protein